METGTIPRTHPDFLWYSSALELYTHEDLYSDWDGHLSYTGYPTRASRGWPHFGDSWWHPAAHPDHTTTTVTSVKDLTLQPLATVHLAIRASVPAKSSKFKVTYSGAGLLLVYVNGERVAGTPTDARYGGAWEMELGGCVSSTTTGVGGIVGERLDIDVFHLPLTLQTLTLTDIPATATPVAPVPGVMAFSSAGMHPVWPAPPLYDPKKPPLQADPYATYVPYASELRGGCANLPSTGGGGWDTVSLHLSPATRIPPLAHLPEGVSPPKGPEGQVLWLRGRALAGQWMMLLVDGWQPSSELDEAVFGEKIDTLADRVKKLAMWDNKQYQEADITSAGGADDAVIINSVGDMLLPLALIPKDKDFTLSVTLALVSTSQAGAYTGDGLLFDGTLVPGGVLTFTVTNDTDTSSTDLWTVLGPGDKTDLPETARVVRAPAPGVTATDATGATTTITPGVPFKVTSEKTEVTNTTSQPITIYHDAGLPAIAFKTPRCVLPGSSPSFDLTLTGPAPPDTVCTAQLADGVVVASRLVAGACTLPTTHLGPAPVRLASVRGWGGAQAGAWTADVAPLAHGAKYAQCVSVEGSEVVSMYVAASAATSGCMVTVQLLDFSGFVHPTLTPEVRVGGVQQACAWDGDYYVCEGVSGTKVSVINPVTTLSLDYTFNSMVVSARMLFDTTYYTGTAEVLRDWCRDHVAPGTSPLACFSEDDWGIVRAKPEVAAGTISVNDTCATVAYTLTTDTLTHTFVRPAHTALTFDPRTYLSGTHTVVTLEAQCRGSDGSISTDDPTTTTTTFIVVSSSPFTPVPWSLPTATPAAPAATSHAGRAHPYTLRNCGRGLQLLSTTPYTIPATPGATHYAYHEAGHGTVTTLVGRPGQGLELPAISNGSKARVGTVYEDGRVSVTPVLIMDTDAVGTTYSMTPFGLTDTAPVPLRPRPAGAPVPAAGGPYAPVERVALIFSDTSAPALSYHIYAGLVGETYRTAVVCDDGPVVTTPATDEQVGTIPFPANTTVNSLCTFSVTWVVDGADMATVYHPLAVTNITHAFAPTVPGDFGLTYVLPASASTPLTTLAGRSMTFSTGAVFDLGDTATLIGSELKSYTCEGRVGEITDHDFAGQFKDGNKYEVALNWPHLNGKVDTGLGVCTVEFYVTTHGTRQTTTTFTFTPRHFGAASLATAVTVTNGAFRHKLTALAYAPDAPAASPVAVPAGHYGRVGVQVESACAQPRALAPPALAMGATGGWDTSIVTYAKTTDGPFTKAGAEYTLTESYGDNYNSLRGAACQHRAGFTNPLVGPPLTPYTLSQNLTPDELGTFTTTYSTSALKVATTDVCAIAGEVNIDGVCKVLQMRTFDTYDQSLTHLTPDGPVVAPVLHHLPVRSTVGPYLVNHLPAFTGALADLWQSAPAPAFSDTVALTPATDLTGALTFTLSAARPAAHLVRELGWRMVHLPLTGTTPAAWPDAPAGTSAADTGLVAVACGSQSVVAYVDGRLAGACEPAGKFTVDMTQGLAGALTTLDLFAFENRGPILDKTPLPATVTSRWSPGTPGCTRDTANGGCTCSAESGSRKTCTDGVCAHDVDTDDACNLSGDLWVDGLPVAYSQTLCDYAHVNGRTACIRPGAPSALTFVSAHGGIDVVHALAPGVRADWVDVANASNEYTYDADITHDSFRKVHVDAWFFSSFTLAADATMLTLTPTGATEITLRPGTHTLSAYPLPHTPAPAGTVSSLYWPAASPGAATRMSLATVGVHQWPTVEFTDMVNAQLGVAWEGGECGYPAALPPKPDPRTMLELCAEPIDPEQPFAYRVDYQINNQVLPGATCVTPGTTFPMTVPALPSDTDLSDLRCHWRLATGSFTTTRPTPEGCPAPPAALLGPTTDLAVAAPAAPALWTTSLSVCAPASWVLRAAVVEDDGLWVVHPPTPRLGLASSCAAEIGRPIDRRGMLAWRVTAGCEVYLFQQPAGVTWRLVSDINETDLANTLLSAGRSATITVQHHRVTADVQFPLTAAQCALVITPAGTPTGIPCDVEGAARASATILEPGAALVATATCGDATATTYVAADFGDLPRPLLTGPATCTLTVGSETHPYVLLPAGLAGSDIAATPTFAEWLPWLEQPVLRLTPLVGYPKYRVTVMCDDGSANTSDAQPGDNVCEVPSHDSKCIVTIDVSTTHNHTPVTLPVTLARPLPSPAPLPPWVSPDATLSTSPDELPSASLSPGTYLVARLCDTLLDELLYVTTETPALVHVPLQRTTDHTCPTITLVVVNQTLDTYASAPVPFGAFLAAATVTATYARRSHADVVLARIMGADVVGGVDPRAYTATLNGEPAELLVADSVYLVLPPTPAPAAAPLQAHVEVGYAAPDGSRVRVAEGDFSIVVPNPADLLSVSVEGATLAVTTTTAMTAAGITVSTGDRTFTAHAGCSYYMGDATTATVTYLGHTREIVIREPAPEPEPEPAPGVAAPAADADPNPNPNPEPEPEPEEPLPTLDLTFVQDMGVCTYFPGTAANAPVSYTLSASLPADCTLTSTLAPPAPATSTSGTLPIPPTLSGEVVAEVAAECPGRAAPHMVLASYRLAPATLTVVNAAPGTWPYLTQDGSYANPLYARVSAYTLVAGQPLLDPIPGVTVKLSQAGETVDTDQSGGYIRYRGTDDITVTIYSADGLTPLTSASVAPLPQPATTTSIVGLQLRSDAAVHTPGAGADSLWNALHIFVQPVLEMTLSASGQAVPAPALTTMDDFTDVTMVYTCTKVLGEGRVEPGQEHAVVDGALSPLVVADSVLNMSATPAQCTITATVVGDTTAGVGSQMSLNLNLYADYRGLNLIRTDDDANLALCPTGHACSADLVPCDPGYSQPLRGKHYCLPCLPGEQQPLNGQASCEPCPIGHADARAARPTCATCTRYRAYAPRAGMQHCDLCPDGEVTDFDEFGDGAVGGTRCRKVVPSCESLYYNVADSVRQRFVAVEQVYCAATSDPSAPITPSASLAFPPAPAAAPDQTDLTISGAMGCVANTFNYQFTTPVPARLISTVEPAWLRPFVTLRVPNITIFDPRFVAITDTSLQTVPQGMPPAAGIPEPTLAAVCPDAIPASGCQACAPLAWVAPAEGGRDRGITMQCATMKTFEVSVPATVPVLPAPVDPSTAAWDDAALSLNWLVITPEQPLMDSMLRCGDGTQGSIEHQPLTNMPMLASVVAVVKPESTATLTAYYPPATGTTGTCGPATLTPSPMPGSHQTPAMLGGEVSCTVRASGRGGSICVATCAGVLVKDTFRDTTMSVIVSTPTLTRRLTLPVAPAPAAVVVGVGETATDQSQPPANLTVCANYAMATPTPVLPPSAPALCHALALAPAPVDTATECPFGKVQATYSVTAPYGHAPPAGDCEFSVPSAGTYTIHVHTPVPAISLATKHTLRTRHLPLAPAPPAVVSTVTISGMDHSAGYTLSVTRMAPPELEDLEVTFAESGSATATVVPVNGVATARVVVRLKNTLDKQPKPLDAPFSFEVTATSAEDTHPLPVPPLTSTALVTVALPSDYVSYVMTGTVSGLVLVVIIALVIWGIVLYARQREHRAALRAVAALGLAPELAPHIVNIVPFIVPSRAVTITGPVLGRGGFGVVIKADYETVPVAIKQLRADLQTEGNLTTLGAEAALLSTIRHPFICSLIAVSVLEGRFSLLFEFCGGGSLKTACYGKTNDEVPIWQRLGWLAQAASALAYLHQADIVHGDVKAANILLNAGTAKLSDLGLAQSVVSARGKPALGTPAWLAPELMAASKVRRQRTAAAVAAATPEPGPEPDSPRLPELANSSVSVTSVGTTMSTMTRPPRTMTSGKTSSKATVTAADVYAFAITMWEVLAGVEPLADVPVTQIPVAVVSNGARPPLDPAISPVFSSPLASLIARAWHTDPRRRPSMQELAYELATAADEALQLDPCAGDATFAAPGVVGRFSTAVDMLVNPQSTRTPGSRGGSRASQEPGSRGRRSALRGVSDKSLMPDASSTTSAPRVTTSAPAKSLPGLSAPAKSLPGLAQANRSLPGLAPAHKSLPGLARNDSAEFK